MQNEPRSKKGQDNAELPCPPVLRHYDSRESVEGFNLDV